MGIDSPVDYWRNVCQLGGHGYRYYYSYACLFGTLEFYHHRTLSRCAIHAIRGGQDGWMGIIFYYTVHYLGAKDVVVQLLWGGWGGINTMMDREVHRRRLSQIYIIHLSLRMARRLPSVVSAGICGFVRCWRCPCRVETRVADTVWQSGRASVQCAIDGRRPITSCYGAAAAAAWLKLSPVKLHFG